MRALFIFIVILILLVLAVPAVIAARFWMDGSDVIARGGHNGALAERGAGDGLTTAEYTIAIDQFSETWARHTIPCRTMSLLWREVSDPSGVSPALPVSQKVAGSLLGDRRATSVRWQMRRFAVACQLEQRFSDGELLRIWLATASFGQGGIGLEAASQAVFAKPSRNLNAEESAKLAALVRSPGLRGQPDRWAERARAIQEHVAATR